MKEKDKHTITLGSSLTEYEVPLMVKRFFEEQQKVFKEMQRVLTAANETLDEAYQKGLEDGKKSMVVDITKL